METNEISEIPIVALSANTSIEDQKKTKKVGMKYHLGKPLVETDLVKILKFFDFNWGD